MNTKNKYFLDTNDHSVHIYSCNIKAYSNLEYFFSILSEDEIIRSRKYKFLKDKNCFTISRGLLRQILGSYLDKDPKGLEFGYTKFGKPYLISDSNINFNVSHSGDMIVIGFVRDHEIGVDVELIKNDFDVLDLAYNFFSNSEITELKKVNKTQLARAFYRCWTRKESFIKAEGIGLSFPLDSFSVSLDNDAKAKLLETNWDKYEAEKWSLHSKPISEDYISAIAVKSKINKVSYSDLSVNDL